MGLIEESAAVAETSEAPVMERKTTTTTVGPGAPAEVEKNKDSGIYPNSKEQIAKARVNLVKMLHSKKLRDVIAKHLQQNPQMAMESLSKMLSMMLAKIITSLKNQTGKKVHPKLIEMLSKLAVKEVANIANAIGKQKMPKQAAVALLRGVVENLKAMLSGKQGQPGQQGEMQGGMSPSPRGPQQGQAAGPPAQGPPQGGIVNGGMQ